MKKSSQILLFILFAGLTAFKSDNLPSVFTNRLNRAQMAFTEPVGYDAVPIVANGQMHYEYALKSPAKNFEIRYAIAPLDSVFIQFEAMKKGGTVMAINPNRLYQSSLMATTMNLSGGKMPEFKEFPKEAVKAEFNADWGATTIVNVTGKFGNGYNTCMIVALHKDNVGDAYIFYLSNNPANYQTMLQPVFHALKFK